jgi:glycosyltransferase involved in cell wall biosynthesis
LSIPKKIVLLTSGQPSLNPRLVKEADTLADAGYEVIVLYAFWNHWGTQHDQQLLPQKEWKAIRVAGDPDQQWFKFTISRLLFKLNRSFFKISGSGAFAARSTPALIKEAKKHPADLYIAHNLGALPAAVKAAKKYGKRCGFDAEDFHRNEVSDDPHHPDVRLKAGIEEKYIPQVDYLTASSPQITEAYQKLFPAKRPVTILNVFQKEPDVKEHTLNESGPIKLFWFSQTIGINRGLQDVTGALGLLDNNHFELHLLGNCPDEVRAEITNQAKITIHFYDPIPSTALAAFASQFDIGLALEPGFSTNNNLALSNKIFTYLQAGLCIVASDTIAQKSLLDSYPAIGTIYTKGNPKVLSHVLAAYNSNRARLLKAQQAAFRIAREKLNWEEEQKKFLAVIKNILTGNE